MRQHPGAKACCQTHAISKSRHGSEAWKEQGAACLQRERLPALKLPWTQHPLQHLQAWEMEGIKYHILPSPDLAPNCQREPPTW